MFLRDIAQSGASSNQLPQWNGTQWGPVSISGDATLAAGVLTLASIISAGGPQGDSSHTQVLTWDAKGRLLTVTNTAIGSLAASTITTGQLALARGGTGVDLSSSGGATYVLAQDASHVISARALVSADIPLNTTSQAGAVATAPNDTTKFWRGDASWAVPPSGLSTALTSAHLYVGNGSNIATSVAASGDVTLANTGAFTVTKLQGNAVKSGTPTDQQVLTWINANSDWEATTWSTGLPAAAHANNTIRDTGSTYATNSSLQSDGNSATVNMGATGTVGLTVNGIASQTADYLSVKDSGASNVFRITSGGQAYLYGSSNPAVHQLVNPSTPSGAGTRLGNVNFDAYSTGTTVVVGSSVLGYSDGAWSSSSAPSRLSFNTVPSGSTTSVENFRIDSAGNVYCNPVGGQLAPGATNGFFYLPFFSNGAPSGTPANVPTGCVPMAFGSAAGVFHLYVYYASAWHPIT